MVIKGNEFNITNLTFNVDLKRLRQIVSKSQEEFLSRVNEKEKVLSKGSLYRYEKENKLSEYRQMKLLKVIEETFKEELEVLEIELHYNIVSN